MSSHYYQTLNGLEPGHASVMHREPAGCASMSHRVPTMLNLRPTCLRLRSLPSGGAEPLLTELWSSKNSRHISGSVLVSRTDNEG